MTGLLIKKEIIQYINSLRFIIASVLIFILIISSIIVSSYEYREKANRISARQRTNQDELSRVNNYRDLNLMGMTIFKPASKLMYFVKGLEESTGETAGIQAFIHPSLGAGIRDNPLFAVFKPVDFLYIVIYVLSITAFIFSYDSISGEKEGGTLKLMLVQGVSRGQVIIGKTLGAFISLSIPFILAFLTGLIFTQVSPMLRLEGEHWIRISIVFILCLLFILIFISVGILVSTLTHRSIIALFSLLFIWITVIVAYPNLSGIFVKKLSPVTEYAEIDGKSEMIFQDGQKESMDRIMKIARKIQGPPSFDSIMDEVVKQGDIDSEKIRLLNEQYHQEILRQLKLLKKISMISPSAALSFASMRLANTGYEYQQKFLEDAIMFRNRFSRLIQSIDDKSKPVETANIPRFNMRTESWQESFAGSLAEIVFLIIYTGIFFALSAINFVRYDVR